MGSYRPRPEWLAVSSQRAKSTKSLRLRTLWTLYSCDTILERLAQPFEDMPPALGEFIEAEDTVVGQQHLPWPRPRPTADQAHIGDRIIGCAEKSMVEVSEASALNPIKNSATLREHASGIARA